MTPHPLFEPRPGPRPHRSAHRVRPLLAGACLAACQVAWPTSHAHAHPADYQSGMYCPARVDRSYDRQLWTAEHVEADTDSRLMEVQWDPDDGETDTGLIACVYAPAMSRQPYPTLHGRFSAHRPDAPGWMRPTEGADWLLCSGATMTRFETTCCPFVPAGPLPPPPAAAPE